MDDLLKAKYGHSAESMLVNPPTFIESYQTEAYDLCDALIARLEALISQTSEDENIAFHFMEGTKTNGGAEQRKDFSFNFGVVDPDLSGQVYQLLDKFSQLYAAKYTGFSQIPCISQDVKVQKTLPCGGFHTWHSETGNKASRSNYRVLTWTLYLNDFPDGEAETEFLDQGVKVTPKKGMLCFFPAGWTHMHRGNPPYTRTKYIATGWYYYVGDDKYGQ